MWSEWQRIDEDFIFLQSNYKEFSPQRWNEEPKENCKCFQSNQSGERLLQFDAMTFWHKVWTYSSFLKRLTFSMFYVRATTSFICTFARVSVCLSVSLCVHTLDDDDIEDEKAFFFFLSACRLIFHFQLLQNASTTIHHVWFNWTV